MIPSIEEPWRKPGFFYAVKSLHHDKNRNPTDVLESTTDMVENTTHLLWKKERLFDIINPSKSS